MFLYETEKGDKTLDIFKNTRKEDSKYQTRLIYHEEDIPHILKASYKYFSRDPSRVPIIMNKFLEQNNLLPSS